MKKGLMYLVVCLFMLPVLFLSGCVFNTDDLENQIIGLNQDITGLQGQLEDAQSELDAQEARLAFLEKAAQIKVTDTITEVESLMGENEIGYVIEFTSTGFPSPNENITFKWGYEAWWFDNGTTETSDDIGVTVYATQTINGSTFLDIVIKKIAINYQFADVPNSLAFVHTDVNDNITPLWT